MLLALLRHPCCNSSRVLPHAPAARTHAHAQHAHAHTGKEIEIDIEPNDSIERIKERIEEKEGIPPVQQRCVA